MRHQIQGPQQLGIMEKAARRCKSIADNLLFFARPHESHVGRTPVGEAPSYPLSFRDGGVVHLDHGGWSWAVGNRPPLDEATARQVVEQVVEGRPYD